MHFMTYDNGYRKVVDIARFVAISKGLINKFNTLACGYTILRRSMEVKDNISVFLRSQALP